MANEYDKILRDNFKDLKAALLRQLVRGSITRIWPLIPKLQHTLERETDTVAEVETAEGKQFIVHIEWQSSNDANMAARMAVYDLLLNQAHQREVLGIIIYLGNEPLRMNDTHSFFKFHYQCEMVDARQLDPELFLQSDDAGEVIFAILTGSSNPEQKTIIIRRIFSKLQQLLAGDTTKLRVKIRQLELLSLLRGEAIQQLILQEESKMPVTIDITKDLRYQQGKTEGVEERDVEIAKRMFENGSDISFIQKITGLSLDKLDELFRSHSTD